MLLLFVLLLSLAPVYSELPAVLAYEEPQEIIVTNRILATVNGISISVIDVMKKMDMLLQRYYPERFSFKFMRFQYYTKNWRDTLTQMIDQELMIADAEHLDVKVSDADVREEIIRRFGANIMITLDSIGVTYEEARAQIYKEIVVQKIMWYRVHSKVYNTVNPQNIKEAYRVFSKNNPPLEKWNYQVLSIRSVSDAIGALLAQRAFDLLEKTHIAFSALPQELDSEEEKNAISLSPELEGNEKTLSASHREVLKQLQPGTFSAPIAQVSRVDQSTVYRIFYLKEHQIQTTPSFEAIADELKDQLLQQASLRESSHYIAKLRQRFSFEEAKMLHIPVDFQPFAVR
jgi:hypothetical protein